MKLPVKIINGLACPIEIIRDFEKEVPGVSFRSKGLKDLRYHVFEVYFKDVKIADVRADVRGWFTEDKVKKLVRQLRAVKKLADMRRPDIEIVEFDI